MSFALAPRLLNKAFRRDVAVVVVLAAGGLWVSHWAVTRSSPPPRSDRGWAGELVAAAEPEAAKTARTPITSSSLVVAPAALALPPVPKPAVQARITCESGDRSCVTRSLPVPPTARRQVASLAVPATPPAAVAAPVETNNAASEGWSGLARKTLDRLPDLATMTRPFTAAGGAIKGWAKSF